MTIRRPEDIGKIQIVFLPNAPRAEKSGNNRRKRGYTSTAQNIYSETPPSPEEHYEVIKDIQTIVQGMQTQGYELEGLAQANAVLTSSKYAVMAQFTHMTVTMNAMQSQKQILASAQTNQARPKIKFYCWSCRINLTDGIKPCSEKKAGHHNEVYYKKRVGGSEKECEWRLGAIFNQFEISNPKIILRNHIDTTPNPTITNML